MTDRIGRAAQPAVAFCALAVVLSACGGGDQAVPAPPTPEGGDAGAVTEYVGKVPGTEFFIAFADGPSGDVEAYLCDGRGGAELFNGRVENGRVALRSADGDTDLNGIVGATDVDGTVTLAGQQRGFRATRATGPGGLYTFTNAVDGTRQTVTGTSERGNMIEGAAQDGQLSATLRTPDGQGRPLPPDQLPSPGSVPPTELHTGYRVILLDSLEGRGKNLPTASTTGTRSGGSTGFTDPLIW